MSIPLFSRIHVQNTTKLDLSIQERFLNLPNMGKVSYFLGGVKSE